MELFERSEAVLGAAAMRKLAAARVLLVGVGGVGSWCAEALVRTGLGHLEIVDDDTVAASNVNRQSPATVETIGRKKVEAMRERLLSVNPASEIIANDLRFETLDGWPDFDLIVDAIDSVDCKASLILDATKRGIPLVSSMGAALRVDPARVVTSRFEKVEGDGLARALRNRFRRLGRFPARKFSCVWSKEPSLDLETRGSLMTVTATFGMMLAAEAIRILTERDER